jgi:RNA polymerase sigma factor (sigma-70 family)
MAMSIADKILEQDKQFAAAIERERPRLRNFIRKRVPDREEAEDILQEIFYELIVAYRMMKPVERVSAWLFRVARNRITDLFRARRPESLSSPVAAQLDEGETTLEDLLISADADPEEVLMQGVLAEALDEALAALPREQREVFIAHELEGRSFQEISAATGVGVNTLLARKRYAVLHLRKRLEEIYPYFEEE